MNNDVANCPRVHPGTCDERRLLIGSFRLSREERAREAPSHAGSFDVTRFIRLLSLSKQQFHWRFTRNSFKYAKHVIYKYIDYNSKSVKSQYTELHSKTYLQ